MILEKLERMARLMPVKNLVMRSIESREGVIYFAHGMDGQGVIHGIWGHREIARTMEFKQGTSVKHARQTLVSDAAGHIEQLIQKGLLSGS